MPSHTIRSIAPTTNLDKLQKVVQGIVGQTCWKAVLGYGEELILHLGSRIPSVHPKLEGELEGEWILGTCGTSWELLTPNETIPSSLGKSRLEKAIPLMEDGAVVSFLVTGDILTLAFDNGCQLRIIPTEEDANEPEVPYWELFMPNTMFVEFRAGGVWFYQRSDQPISQ